CCQVHDDCYGKCGDKGCWPKLSPYTFSCIAENRTAVCDNEVNSECDSCACSCDTNAAHCFKRNDKYYHGKASCKS
uniref:Phospholipase A2 domain-containing protein n=1 Tax=Romanomermis culicivorax TaxID=13658 RepID=A0A915IMD5_ROMCU